MKFLKTFRKESCEKPGISYFWLYPLEEKREKEKIFIVALLIRAKKPERRKFPSNGGQICNFNYAHA